MPRLLYHATSALPTVSPFDEAATLVVRDGPIRLASPYIGVSYIERLLVTSTQWRIISDVQEWLTSLSLRVRPRAWSFIRANLGRIHHCSALHAKVIIGSRLAMLGSANFTRAGMLHRAEMGILLDDEKHVAELSSWFDNLWNETAPPEANEASEFIQWLDEQAAQKPVRHQKISISSKNNVIRARLVSKARAEVTADAPPTTLDLADVAKSLIVAEQERFESIEQAIESAIERASLLGNFSFVYFRDLVRTGFPDASNREIYIRLLTFCSNHPRTVFVENTVKEFTIVQGCFAVSTAELVLKSLQLFDDFLVFLIKSLRFNSFDDMPGEAAIQQSTSFDGRAQQFMVAELLDSGFIDLEDLPGRLPRYQLNQSFSWKDRFLVFKRARIAWDAAIQRRPKQETQPDEDLDQLNRVKVKLSLESFPDEADEEFPWEDLNQHVHAGLVEREVEKERVAWERKQKIDTVLSCVLSSLVAEERLIGKTVGEIAKQISTKCGVGARLVEMVLSSKHQTANILRISYGLNGEYSVEINQRIVWEDLADFPETRKVCEAILSQ